jgi:hypothetical protein
MFAIPAPTQKTFEAEGEILENVLTKSLHCLRLLSGPFKLVRFGKISIRLSKFTLAFVGQSAIAVGPSEIWL